MQGMPDPQEEVVDVNEPLVATASRPREEPKIVSTNKRLGLLGIMAVVAATALFFSAEESVAESKIWSSEIAMIKNGSALPDESGLRYMLVSNLTWDEAELACKDRGYSLCKPSYGICGKESVTKNDGQGQKSPKRRLLGVQAKNPKAEKASSKERRSNDEDEEEDFKLGGRKPMGDKNNQLRKSGDDEDSDDDDDDDSKKAKGNGRNGKNNKDSGDEQNKDKQKMKNGKKMGDAGKKIRDDDDDDDSDDDSDSDRGKGKGKGKPGKSKQGKAAWGLGKKKSWEKQDISNHPGLCWPHKCSNEFHKTVDKRFTPVLGQGGKEGTNAWLAMDKCNVKFLPDDEEKLGLVTCCNKAGKVTGAFPSEVMQKATKQIKAQKMNLINAMNTAAAKVKAVSANAAAKAAANKDGGGGSSASRWSFSGDSMRSNDPFLKSKLQGKKMKTFGEHATEQLGDKSLTEHVQNIHGKVKDHISTIISALGKNGEGAKGAVSGKERSDDPFKSGAVAPLSAVADSDRNPLSGPSSP